MKPFSVIDAPSDLGLGRPGVRGLPPALRAAGLLEGISDVRHDGEIPVPAYDPLRDDSSGIANVDGIATFSRRLAERVGTTLDLGRFPLVLGGDCSILLGPALALKRRGRYGLFFIDGHADFYSPESEPAGEAASMDLALVTGHGPDALADLDGRGPLVREADAAVFGFRDAEAAAAEGSPDVLQTAMCVMDLADVRRMGPTAAAKRGVAELEEKRVEGFWLHVDADVLHDDVMPAVDYRMPNGLWPQELTAALAVIMASPLVTGMQITIYNPDRDDADRSAARILAKAVRSALPRGPRISG